MDVKDLDLKSSSPHLSTSNNLQDEEDDLPTLSPFALEALKEFLSEQNFAVKDVDGDACKEKEEKEVSLLQEDWRMSQFWYTPETAETVAREVMHLCNEMEESVTPSIACISCPTLFVYLKKMYPDVSVRLLEYDKRFKQYGDDYTYYDYNEPEELPQEMKHAYQILVIDPPYLSGECLEKVAQTVSYLAHPRNCHLLLLTGDVQRDKAAKLLKLHPCGFRPEHSSKLGNEFRLFTNYNPGTRLGGWDLEE